MARRQKITAGELNVRLHPHSPALYSSFINGIYELRRPIKVFGDRFAMISLLDRSDAEQGVFQGFITSFTKIDFSQPWFDSSTLEEADTDKISGISIPPDLFPNSQAFHFLFDTKKHKIYIQTYSKGKVLSINSAARLFEGLANDLSIMTVFNEAKITVAQSKEGLAVVLSIPVIKRITIVISKPNADVFEDDFDEKVEDFLGELNSRQMTVSFDADAGQSIVPNAAVRRVAASGIDHGYVEVSGRDNNGATKMSTAEFPKQIHDRYDPDVISEAAAFRAMTGQ